MRITTFTREGDRDITNLVATWSLGVGAVLAVLGFGAVFAPMVAAIALDIAIGSLLVAAVLPRYSCPPVRSHGEDSG